jgi:hypothetical protein
MTRIAYKKCAGGSNRITSWDRRGEARKVPDRDRVIATASVVDQ